MRLAAMWRLRAPPPHCICATAAPMGARLHSRRASTRHQKVEHRRQPQLEVDHSWPPQLTAPCPPACPPSSFADSAADFVVANQDRFQVSLAIIQKAGLAGTAGNGALGGSYFVATDTSLVVSARALLLLVQ